MIDLCTDNCNKYTITLFLLIKYTVTTVRDFWVWQAQIYTPINSVFQGPGPGGANPAKLCFEWKHNFSVVRYHVALKQIDDQIKFEK